MRILIATLLLAVPSVVSADNWPHWRGPTGNGVALNAEPPTEWGETKNVKWKVPIPGRGSGSPVVWGNRIFVVTAVPAGANSTAGGEAEEQPAPIQERRRRSRDSRRDGGGAHLQTFDFLVLCIDRENGDLLWKRTAVTAKPHQGTHQTNGFASASPCTDGEHVYASFGSRGVYCYTMDGDLVWSRADFPPMTTRAGFGEGSSPTIAGETLLLPWDHEGQSALYALDKSNGETRWKADRDEPTEWSTPLVVDTEQGRQVVINGQNFARGYDLNSGKELWRSAGQTERPVASAVWMDDLAVVTSGFRGSYMGAFRLDGRGDLRGTDSVAWSLSQNTPDIASPILSNGRIYFHKGKTGILSCVDAKSGDVLFGPSRIPEIRSTYASPVAAGGFVFLTGRSGTTVVINDSDQLEIVSVNSVGEGVDATPAAVDDELFIRGERNLFCIENAAAGR